MIELESVSGLPLKLTDDGSLVFGVDVVTEESKVRPLDGLAPVALVPEACRGRREPAYFMYNGVYHRAHADRLAGRLLRYELTLIPPRLIGQEFVKTFGHLHHPEPSSRIGYVEICEVLVGTAHFLFQTLDLNGPRAGRVFYVEATTGQKVVVPPGLDHCTINPGPGPLLFADVVHRGVEVNYERFRATRGAAYLEISQNGRREFVVNPTYRSVAPLDRVPVWEFPALNLTDRVPLYRAFAEAGGENWPFLTDPRHFSTAFPQVSAWLVS